MKDTKIISGFPGIGKSFLAQHTGFTYADSDSSSYSWLSPGVRNPEFPENYINHIKGLIGELDYILVSSHEVVREALEEHDIHYTLVYPKVELRDEYLKRYLARGNDEKFVSFISTHWDQFISDIEGETYPTLIKLENNQYLLDVISNVRNLDEDERWLHRMSEGYKNMPNHDAEATEKLQKYIDGLIEKSQDLETFYSYFEGLYKKGLEVNNTNGTSESFDRFFEAATVVTTNRPFKVSERDIPSQLTIHLGLEERAIFARMLTAYKIEVSEAASNFDGILKAGLKREYNHRFPENKVY